MKVYLIPGLGYDHRIFENLDLGDTDIEHINWIEPKLNESIHDYSIRLFSSIKEADEKVILIGHSFGAIVSQQIASVKNIDKIILISSIRSRKELPFFFRIMAPLKLNLFFTKELTIKTFKYWAKDHGYESHIEKELFKAMVAKQSNNYLKWAAKALSMWRAPKISTGTQTIQIHGTKDKTFPFYLINKPDISIENGTHIMVYKQAKKISDILMNEIRKTQAS